MWLSPTLRPQKALDGSKPSCIRLRTTHSVGPICSASLSTKVRMPLCPSPTWASSTPGEPSIWSISVAEGMLPPVRSIFPTP